MTLQRVATLDGIHCLTTTEVARRLGLQVGVALLKSLGIEPLAETHTGTYWRNGDFPRICWALASHCADTAMKRPADFVPQTHGSPVETGRG